MKALPISLVAGVLFAGAGSADAQFLLFGRTFDVTGKVGLCESYSVQGQASFGAFELEGAYWEEIRVQCADLTFPGELNVDAGAQYVELPLGPTASLAKATRQGLLTADSPYGVISLELDLTDWFYVWRSGSRTYFICIPTTKTESGPAPHGFLIGAETFPSLRNAIAFAPPRT